jgi:hypothetical protein
VMCMTFSTIIFYEKTTINTALHTSGKDVQDKANCIVGVYCNWVYNASSGCTGIVGIYSDWVYNAKCIVGTTHMLKTKPVVLRVHNASYVVGVSGNHDNSDTRVGLRNIATTFLHCSPGKDADHRFSV